MEEKNYIECATHGHTEPALICHHLVDNGRTQALGFYQADIDPDNREWGDLNAWCGQCDAMLESEGEWNDASEAFADIKVVCIECYRAIYQAQLTLDPSLVEVDDDKNEGDDQFWQCADTLIDVANQYAKEASIPDVGLAFLYAAARYNAFMTMTAKLKNQSGIERSKEEGIEHICKNFRAMLVENIEEYQTHNKSALP
jgi:hypothetical protein